jgi:hypothetical protein
MPLRLRDYIYLDDDLVERLLSQAEHGVHDEEQRTDTEKVDKRRGAALRGGPASAQLGRSTGKEISSSKTVRQTPDSACSRLIELLEDEGSLQFLDAFDDEIWNQLGRGEALEVEGSLEVSGLVQPGGIAEAIGPILEIVEPSGDDFDPKSMEAMKAMAALMGTMKAVPVIAHASGAPDYSFIVSLKSDALRVAQDQLTGEATIFGTLQRRLRPGESWSVLDVMGFAGLPRNLRRQMQKDLSNSAELEGLVVEPPAALLNPIAIYR